MGFGIKLISIVSGVMLLASCSSTRSVSRHQSMPERDRFLTMGYLKFQYGPAWRINGRL